MSHSLRSLGRLKAALFRAPHANVSYMNCLYFACKSDKTYVDVGYRWAYWLLVDSGKVKKGEPVNIESVIKAKDYWNPPEEEKNDWLCNEILPNVYAYLMDRKQSEIIFIDDDFIFSEEELGNKWVEIKS